MDIAGMFSASWLGIYSPKCKKTPSCENPLTREHKHTSHLERAGNNGKKKVKPYLLELVDSTLVNSTALVDQVT